MDLKYNQIMFRKMCTGGELIIHFIYYRKEIDMIVYDFEGSVYQCKKNETIIATASEIYNYYESKINKYNKSIHANYIYKKCHNIRNKDILKKVQILNIRLKELNEKRYAYTIIEKLANDNTCYKYINDLDDKIDMLYDNKKNLLLDYKNNIYQIKRDYNQIKHLKNEVGIYKQKRKKLLKEGIYIEDK